MVYGRLDMAKLARLAGISYKPRWQYGFDTFFKARLEFIFTCYLFFAFKKLSPNFWWCWMIEIIEIVVAKSIINLRAYKRYDFPLGLVWRFGDSNNI